MTKARDIDTVWRELADIQQAGLDAALIAERKSRKPKAVPPASDTAAQQVTANGEHPSDTTGTAEGLSGLPDQDQALEADAAQDLGLARDTKAEGNGHLASEENQAANRQLIGAGNTSTTSASKSQVDCTS